MLSRTIRVASILATVLAVACDGESGSRCLPDLDALAAEPLCLADDDCPCGGHCDLGVCVAVCTVDSECGSGQRCDGSGRCRAASDPSELPPLPTDALGGVRLVPGAIVAGAAGPSRVDVDVLGRPVDRARVVAGDELLEVSCSGPDGPFARHCELASLAVGHHSTYVRAIGPLPPGTSYSVAVHTATGRSFASVRGEALDALADDPGLAGTYGGAATLAQHGVDDELTDLAGVAIALDAVLYPDGPGGMRLAIDDPQHVFGPRERWVVALEEADGVWTASAPALVVGDRLVEPTFQAAGVGAGVLELAFELRTIGLTHGAAAVQRWSVHMARVGDLADEAAPDLPAPESIDLGELAGRQNTVPLRWAQPAPVRALGACVGTTPADASECAQQHLCWESSATSLEAGTLRRALDDFTTWGDLRCDAGVRSAALEYFDSAEDPSVTARVLLERCASDLERYWDAPADVDATVEGLRALSAGVEGCLDARRFDAALDAALTTARARATSPAVVADGAATTLGTRLLYQWAQIHGFLATEALESDTLVAITGSPGDSNERSLDDYLALSLAGWDLVLHPRVTHALLGVQGNHWGLVDYREHFAGSAFPSTPPLHHEQGVALPVVFAETLTRQLEGARALVSRARFAGTGHAPALEIAGRSTHAASLVLALTDVIAARATSPRWHDRYLAARAGALAALTALHREVRALRRGENPLGVRPTDLPLTFAGDPASPAARFSAVSDFLVGSTPSSSAWAPAAVDRAEMSLQAARDAWVAHRERELDAVIQTVEVDRRMDALRAHYDDQLSALCGVDASLETWDPAGGLCFVDPASRCDATRSALGREAPSVEIRIEDVELLRCHLRASSPNAGAPLVVGHPDAAIDGALRSTESARIESREVRIGSTRFPVSELYSVTIATLGEYDGCAAENPEGRFPLPRPEMDPSCVRGGLGDALLDVHRARQALELARVELASFEQSFDIAMESCRLMQESADTLDALQDTRDNIVHGLRTAKLLLDMTANSARTAAEAVNPSDVLFSGGGSVAAYTVALVAENVSMAVEFGIETTITEFDQRIAEEERLAAVRICLNDARAHLVGAQAAAMGADHAFFELKVAIENLVGLYASVAELVEEGRAAIALERARVARVAGARAPLANARWLSAEVDAFRRDMRLAQRATFLATRAVGYELQADVRHLEAGVLAAQRPDELRAVIDELLTLTANRGVGGRSPSQLVTVFSMREQLFRLAERAGRPAPERFADVFEPTIDASGRRGYRVPFSLLPGSGSDGAGALGIFAGTDCAERVWTVAASVRGRDLYLGGDPPSFVRLDLLKSNTFASQWCDGRDGLQVAAFEPGRNLFADPAHGTAVGTSAGSPTEGFTRGRMRAFFGVDRAELERDHYTEGASPELGGRGLYGDYALFFPEEVISVAGGPGLSLDAVEDILLRFEYVSVAR